MRTELGQPCLAVYVDARSLKVTYALSREGCRVMAAVVKDARLSPRLNQADDALIGYAADAQGQTVSEFLTSSAVDRAHEVMGIQRHFVRVEDVWDRFVEILAAPASPDPRLVELLSRPRRIER